MTANFASRCFAAAFFSAPDPLVPDFWYILPPRDGASFEAEMGTRSGEFIFPFIPGLPPQL
jgi:hypothetical protein